MKKQVVIIGGGIIGLNCAFYLSQEGHDVTVVDRNHPTENLNCSMGNAGMIVPSHFIPLAAPGIIGQGVKWLINPRSPFYIKPRFDMNTLSWLYKFWISANEKHVKRSSPILKSMNCFSLDLFKEIHKSGNIDFYFKERGLLLICKTEKTFGEEIHLSKAANELGLKTVELDKSKLKELEPDMEMNVAGGVLYPGDAHISPEAFIENMFNYLKQKPNVRFVTNEEISEIVKDKNSVNSIVTKSGEVIKGDEFVLAAGHLSPTVVKQLNIKMPMLGGKGYSLTVKQQTERLITPSILCEARVAVTPWDDTIRFGGTMELGGEEHTINPLRIEGIVNSINKYFPNYNCAPFKEVTPWSGLRPCSPDGLPYIGRFKKLQNLIAATGHSMMGLSTAPATGSVINSLVNGTKPGIDIDLFAPDRFNG